MSTGQGSFTRFINSTEMTSLGSFNRVILWFLGSLVFTVVSAILMLRQVPVVLWTPDMTPEQASAAATLLLTSHTVTQAAQQAGLYLAGLLLAAWTGGTIAGLTAHKNQRETSREYVEAIERGKANTQPAVKVEKVQTMEVATGNGEAGVHGGAAVHVTRAAMDDSEEVEEEHRWRDREAKDGLG